ncbi:3326_t:CDS:2, partial [Paraglomus occultum]
MDQLELVSFVLQYMNDYGVTKEEAIQKYNESKQAEPSSASTDAAFTKEVLHLAFQTEFQDSDNFLSAINVQLNKVANEEGYYNYLPIVQSSGYGKTRAIIQLATARPLIYVCLRQVDSTGYPPKTPKSSEILLEIENAEEIDDAEEIASQWLESMIWVFRDMHLEKRSHELLSDETKANEFWNRVSTVKENISLSELQEQFSSGTETGKIAIFLDESSHLL